MVTRGHNWPTGHVYAVRAVATVMDSEASTSAVAVKREYILEEDAREHKNAARRVSKEAGARCR